jgi:integrase
VLARGSAGVTDATIQREVRHQELMHEWFGRPLWEMEPTDADAYFGKALKKASASTRSARAQSLSTYFQFLELRHKTEIYNLTGRVIECPLDEMNRPRAHVDARLRVPPSDAEIEELFAGWPDELAVCRKYATAARNYAVARLMADIGLRIGESRLLDLEDIRWDLGMFGKVNVRFGKGSQRRGPKQRIVPLINGADGTLRWFIEDVWAHFAGDHTRPRAPLFPSERKNDDGSCRPAGRSLGWPLAAARRAALRSANPVRRVSNAIDAAISRARRVTRARGSPVPVAAHASAIRSSATTVTRSPLRTDSPVRVASSPNAVTLIHRVMPSPAPRAGMSRARRSSTPSVPSRVVKVCASSWTARRSPPRPRRSGTPGRRTTRQPPRWPSPGWTGWCRSSPDPAAATSSPSRSSPGPSSSWRAIPP